MLVVNSGIGKKCKVALHICVKCLTVEIKNELAGFVLLFLLKKTNCVNAHQIGQMLRWFVSL